MLEVDTLLNLGELRLDPGVVLVTMSVEFGQAFQTFFGLVVINEPARGLSYIRYCIQGWGMVCWIPCLGEEHDQKTLEHSSSNLQAQRQLPLGVVVWRKASVGDPGSA